MKRWFVFCLLSSVMLHAAEVRINDQGQIEAPGREVRVFRGDAATPLFGSVSKENDSMCFTPSLPFVAGESYRVEFQATDGTWSTQRLRVELPDAVLHAIIAFEADG